MSATKRIETSKTCCECGNGEFLFYACEADRWLFVEEPHEAWFEMHILCDRCSGLFRKYRLIEVSQQNQESHWKLTISAADQVPCHPYHGGWEEDSAHANEARLTNQYHRVGG